MIGGISMNRIFKDKFLLFTDASVDGKVDTRNGNIVVGGVVIVHQSPDSIIDVKLFPFKQKQMTKNHC